MVESSRHIIDFRINGVKEAEVKEDQLADYHEFSYQVCLLRRAGQY